MRQERKVALLPFVLPQRGLLINLPSRLELPFQEDLIHQAYHVAQEQQREDREQDIFEGTVG